MVRTRWQHGLLCVQSIPRAREASRRAFGRRWRHYGGPPSADWEAAHRIVMEQEDKDCAWVHAHLHRVEGDLDNARYWYRQADRPENSGAFEDEWNAIAQALLN